MAVKGQIAKKCQSSDPDLPTPRKKDAGQSFGQRQNDEGEAREAAKRQKRGEVENYDACRGEFMAADVDKLIEDASKTAAAFFTAQGSEDGEVYPNSQEFHLKIKALLEGFTGVVSLASLGGIMCDIMGLSYGDTQLCRPQPIAGKSDLFPLPAHDAARDPSSREGFLQALLCGLNSLAGHRPSAEKRHSPTAFRVQKRLRKIVEESPFLDEPIPKLDFEDFFSTKTLDYTGDEIKLAKRLKWESIAPSLPDEVGLLSLRDYCQGGVLHYVDHFPEYMVPLEEQHVGRTPRVFVDDVDWAPLVKGLLEKGICEVYKESDIHQIRGQCLLNGLFSVS